MLPQFYVSFHFKYLFMAVEPSGQLWEWSDTHTHTQLNNCVLIQCNTVLLTVELLSKLDGFALVFYRIVVTSLGKCHGACKTFILLFICFLLSSQNEPSGPAGLPVIPTRLEENGQIQKDLL